MKDKITIANIAPDTFGHDNHNDQDYDNGQDYHNGHGNYHNYQDYHNDVKTALQLKERVHPHLLQPLQVFYHLSC